MKKILLSLIAALGLVLGGVAVAAPAQAAGNSVQNWSLSTCNAQYKDHNGVIRNIAPSWHSVYSVWMVRIPVGCHGEIAQSQWHSTWVLTPGIWKSFTSMFPSGTNAIVWSYKN